MPGRRTSLSVVGFLVAGVVACASDDTAVGSAHDASGLEAGWDLERIPPDSSRDDGPSVSDPSGDAEGPVDATLGADRAAPRDSANVRGDDVAETAAPFDAGQSPRGDASRADATASSDASDDGAPTNPGFDASNACAKGLASDSGVSASDASASRCWDTLVTSDSGAADAGGNGVDAILRGVAIAPTLEPLPDGLLLMDILHRRYGVPAFATAADDFDAVLAGATPTEAPSLRVFRRVTTADRVVQPGDLASLTNPIDSITARALHCQCAPLPDGYADTLANGRDAGAYSLTHVALSLQWLDENGCPAPTSAAFRADVEVRVENLVNLADGLTDLEIEAMAMLLYLDRADLFDDGWLNALLEHQRSDGGWGPAPQQASNYHPTLLALWALFELQCPIPDGPAIAR